MPKHSLSCFDVRFLPNNNSPHLGKLPFQQTNFLRLAHLAIKQMKAWKQQIKQVYLSIGNDVLHHQT